MNPEIPPSGRVTARRLAEHLGLWRRGGSRHGAADLAAGIRMLVLDGRLPPGTGLPPERELAEALGVSRTLVASAWERLRTSGLVVSRRGAGSWTAVPRGRSSGGLADEPADAHQLIDLARAVPEAIPGVAAAAEAALPRFTAELGGHGLYEQGLPELRARIAQRFTERGLPTEPDEILVTNGAHHGLAMALRVLVGPGDRVLLEQPTYPNAIEAVRAAHALPVPVAMTEDGWDLDGLEATLRQAAPRLAYLVVDFQNPTGHQLDEAGRARLGTALRRARTPVVIDETHVDLDLRDSPASPPPFAAFAGDLVLATGSAAKSHWGGLRIGWIRASRELVNRLLVARRGLDLGSPVFEQLVLAELLAAPPAALVERRARLAAQRDALADALARECPDWSFHLPDGGLSLWCRLPAPVSTRVAAVAQNFGVRVAPGSFFAVHGGLEHWLRLPFTRPSDVLAEAVRRLASAAASVAECGAPMADNGPVPVT
ncbi:MocR-like transcription factor YczR [Actinophytocola xanthii]|uniref:GntR family transcriptional regulator n=1 Tax=Actinophytocola xanthii TaxID=1912961 RepID=A0A1Q8CMZ9_9PSEU|nr:PLP-dependent aminotransferase family protein [Actinophytocola xanthii]OLF15731.1 GntR family transcriptional regulator [Actinophytocola xanthii]